MSEGLSFSAGAGPVTASGDQERERLARRAIVAGAEWMQAARKAGWSKAFITLYQDGDADVAPDLLAAVCGVFSREPAPEIIQGVVLHLWTVEQIGWQGYQDRLCAMNRGNGKGVVHGGR